MGALKRSCIVEQTSRSESGHSAPLLLLLLLLLQRRGVRGLLERVWDEQPIVEYTS